MLKCKVLDSDDIFPLNARSFMQKESNGHAPAEDVKRHSGVDYAP